MPARILVVDDIIANLRLLQSKLEREYYVVETAQSGKEALAMVADAPPDLIILDIMMPETSGYEVTRRLRDNPATADIPILMLSALSEAADRIRALDLGADDFLIKPPNDIHLLARVRSLIRLKRVTDELRLHRDLSGDTAGDGPPPGRLAPAAGAVLLVAQDMTFAQEVNDLLAGDGHRLAIVSDRDQALAAATTRELVLVAADHDPQPDLLLCSRLRAAAATRHLPILVVTRDGGTEVAARALDLGVNDIVARPLERAELMARVRTQLRRHRRASQLRAFTQEAVNLSVRDPLTGVFNRRYMERRLGSALGAATPGAGGAAAGDESGRLSDRPLSLMMIDVDHFKSVNDSYGHGVGDEVLRTLCGRISASLRDSDILGRMGGEKFLVLLPRTALPLAMRVAERVRRTVEAEPMPVSHPPALIAAGRAPAEGAAAAPAAGAGVTALPITVSIGVAEAEAEDGDLQRVLTRADRALYDAKADGRNRVVAIANGGA